MTLTYTGGNINTASKKILIFLNAENKYPNTPPEKVIAIFIVVIILMALLIIAIIIVSIYFTLPLVTVTCLNPISIYTNNICKTDCRYGATSKKQVCNQSPKAILGGLILEGLLKRLPDDPVNPVKPVNPVNPVDPVNPVNPVNPVKPPAVSCNDPNDIYVAANNTCKHCTAGVTAARNAQCNRVCGLNISNKICNPNTNQTCVKNYNILYNTVTGNCDYHKGCTYKSGPNNSTITRITADKKYCNAVCIQAKNPGNPGNAGNTAYSRSRLVFDWTSNGKCVQNCQRGPALLGKVPAYSKPNTVTGIPQCNAACNYVAQTNTTALGLGGCTAINNVCTNNNYNYTTAEGVSIINNKVTNKQTLKHGCNDLCSPYISKNTTKGGCTTNCAPVDINAPYTAVFDGVNKCNCPGDNGSFIGTFKTGANGATKRKCNDKCNDYNVSKNNDSGGCVCMNSNLYTYTLPNHYCTLKQSCKNNGLTINSEHCVATCPNTAKKIMAPNAQGICETMATCPSCVNAKGTACNDQVGGGLVCQSWNSAGGCNWVRPYNYGYKVYSDCYSGHTGNIGKFVPKMNILKTATKWTHCTYTVWGVCYGAKQHTWVTDYSIKTKNNAVSKPNGFCVPTNANCHNCQISKRTQCPG